MAGVAEVGSFKRFALESLEVSSLPDSRACAGVPRARAFTSRDTLPAARTSCTGGLASTFSEDAEADDTMVVLKMPSGFTGVGVGVVTDPSAGGSALPSSDGWPASPFACHLCRLFKQYFVCLCPLCPGTHPGHPTVCPIVRFTYCVMLGADIGRPTPSAAPTSPSIWTAVMQVRGCHVGSVTRRRKFMLFCRSADCRRTVRTPIIP
jgi:hypothetical protein